MFYPSGDKAITCPCKEGGVDGTSASAPAFAGLVVSRIDVPLLSPFRLLSAVLFYCAQVSLLNGHLLGAGKTALGFLNPLVRVPLLPLRINAC